MKKTFGFLALCMFLAVGCTKTSIEDTALDATNEDGTSVIGGRKCASHEIFEEQIKNDPGFAARVAKLEAFTQRAISDPAARLLPDGTIEIPVIVNLVYKTDQENISDGQIASQIAVLNEDFAGSNADVNTNNVYNAVKAGNTKITFKLEAVKRKQTSVSSWSSNNAVKYTSSGGLDATTPQTHLNIWVCNLGGGLLGYAQFPGGSLATDGVVVLYSAFGSKSKHPSGTYVDTYDLGRTTTHEVGHYLNLRHIWGDRRCGNDYVADTPEHTGANYGCQSTTYRSGCKKSPLWMWMNYMDYTNDNCMWMFTKGQSDRMKAVFAAGQARASMGKP